MPIFWLRDDTIAFPHPDLANADGIVAVGGDLCPERLLKAYSIGLFPWFNPDDPILWWSPDPRFVLYPNELRVAKSMRPYFNQNKFTVTFDQHFEEVMRGCQIQYRKGQVGGTWISEEMIQGYTALHRQGYAHSVEVWQADQLVGGLYGLSLGKVFFGESMFSRVSNSSKFALISLVRILDKLDFWIIDCQQPTQHLKSFGARGISRKEFLDILRHNSRQTTLKGNWGHLLGPDK